MKLTPAMSNLLLKLVPGPWYPVVFESDGRIRLDMRLGDGEEPAVCAREELAWLVLADALDVHRYSDSALYVSLTPEGLALQEQAAVAALVLPSGIASGAEHSSRAAAETHAEVLEKQIDAVKKSFGG